MSVCRPLNFVRAALLVASCALMQAGYAQTSGTIAVSASVVSTCLIAAGPLAFGAYSGAATNANATLTTTCTSGAPATILLSEGTNPAGGSTPAAPLRQMKIGDGTNKFLSYQLYITAPGTNVWGNTLATGKAITGAGVAELHTVYGTIPASQFSAPAGVYSDSVTATISF